jgi:alpha,alpha-trehalase
MPTDTDLKQLRVAVTGGTSGLGFALVRLLAARGARKDLWTIRTTAIAPVDLNTLMMHLERVLAKAYRLKGDLDDAQHYELIADKRADAIRRLMWNPKVGLFTDYLWQDRRQSDALSAATVFPLFFGVATPVQAHAVATALRHGFLEPGGLGTTRTASGQQWDQPNGWPPLQYLAIEGLNAYRERNLAREIATRWLRRNVEAYTATGVLLEKYNVEQKLDRRSSGGGGGGEYPLQVGFGRTNGALAKLMAEYPQLTTKASQQDRLVH